MKKVIGIGKQSFEDIIQSNCFYVDKTSLIKEWWESEDDITLITRPRRFGKMLTSQKLSYSIGFLILPIGDFPYKINVFSTFFLQMC